MGVSSRVVSGIEPRAAMPRRCVAFYSPVLVANACTTCVVLPRERSNARTLERIRRSTLQTAQHLQLRPRPRRPDRPQPTLLAAFTARSTFQFDVNPSLLAHFSVLSQPWLLTSVFSLLHDRTSLALVVPCTVRRVHGKLVRIVRVARGATCTIQRLADRSRTQARCPRVAYMRDRRWSRFDLSTSNDRRQIPDASRRQTGVR